jgi:zinc finger protein
MTAPVEEAEEDLEHGIQTFHAQCSQCNAPCETRMHMLGIILFANLCQDIPHFKEVIVMSTVCDSCGFKSNEVKAGGAISTHGRCITLKLTDKSDLYGLYLLIFKVTRYFEIRDEWPLYPTNRT